MGRTHCVCPVGMRVPQYGRSDVAPLLFYLTRFVTMELAGDLVFGLAVGCTVGGIIIVIALAIQEYRERHFDWSNWKPNITKEMMTVWKVPGSTKTERQEDPTDDNEKQV